jgi:hypothetical protein
MSAGSPVTGYVVYERAVYEAADVVLGGAAVPDGVLAHFLASSASDLTVDTIKYNGLGNTSQSATISGLTAGSHYVYVVAAMSAVGVGNKSAALTVSTTPAAPSGLASVAQTASTVNLTATTALVEPFRQAVRWWHAMAQAKWQRLVWREV